MNYHGIAVVRFEIHSDGHVDEVRLILDRVKQLVGAGIKVCEVLSGLQSSILRNGFPASGGTTLVTLPIGFGNRLSELR
jgi:hypothetical protein